MTFSLLGLSWIQPRRQTAYKSDTSKHTRKITKSSFFLVKQRSYTVQDTPWGIKLWGFGIAAHVTINHKSQLRHERAENHQLLPCSYLPLVNILCCLHFDLRTKGPAPYPVVISIFICSLFLIKLKFASKYTNYTKITILDYVCFKSLCCFMHFFALLFGEDDFA